MCFSPQSFVPYFTESIEIEFATKALFLLIITSASQLLGASCILLVMKDLCAFMKRDLYLGSVRSV